MLGPRWSSRSSSPSVVRTLMFRSWARTRMLVPAWRRPTPMGWSRLLCPGVDTPEGSIRSCRIRQCPACRGVVVGTALGRAAGGHRAVVGEQAGRVPVDVSGCAEPSVGVVPPEHRERGLSRGELVNHAEERAGAPIVAVILSVPIPHLTALLVVFILVTVCGTGAVAMHLVRSSTRA